MPCCSWFGSHLVSRIDDGRYGLLETLREYASDKLHARGAELPATRDRHAAFYSDLVQRFDPSSATKLLPVFEYGTHRS